MKNVEIAKVIVLVLSSIVATSGCTIALRATHMVPSVDRTTLPLSDKTLRIVEVKGGENPNPWSIIEAFKIEDAGFRDALVKTLDNSRIFRNIVEEQNSHYDLYVI